MKGSWRDLPPRQRRRRRKALVRQTLLALCGLAAAACVGLGFWALVPDASAEEPQLPDRQVAAPQPLLVDCKSNFQFARLTSRFPKVS
ncbi:MAG: hypothetical protein SOZ49_08545 [Clostridiaceae bacterium]|nr:hypothetical protein [Clostridia bacterium]MDY3871261.1 hypothetical protein [Clostridiaceae bacterium]